MEAGTTIITKTIKAGARVVGGGGSSRVTRGQTHLQPRVGAQRRGDRGDAVVADAAAAARELEQLLVGS